MFVLIFSSFLKGIIKPKIKNKYNFTQVTMVMWLTINGIYIYQFCAQPSVCINCHAIALNKLLRNLNVIYKSGLS